MRLSLWVLIFHRVDFSHFILLLSKYWILSIINQALSKTKELPEIESRYFASEEEFPSLLASRQFIKAVILTDVCRYRFYAIPKFCIIAEFFTLHYQAEALIRCTYEALLEKGHKTIPGFAVPFGTQTNQFERQGEHLVGNAYSLKRYSST